MNDCMQKFQAAYGRLGGNPTDRDWNVWQAAWLAAAPSPAPAPAATAQQGQQRAACGCTPFEQSQCRGEFSPVALHTECAALSAQAEPRAAAAVTERWNIERDGDALLVCFNDHEKGEGCQYQRFVPAADSAAVMVSRSWLEALKNDINTLATLSLKADRYSVGVSLKQSIADALQPAPAPAQPEKVDASGKNWHAHHVAVNKAALQMVRNALRNDAESGRSVRAEMLEELDKATFAIPAQQLSEAEIDEAFQRAYDTEPDTRNDRRWFDLGVRAAMQKGGAV